MDITLKVGRHTGRHLNQPYRRDAGTRFLVWEAGESEPEGHLQRDRPYSGRAHP